MMKNYNQFVDDKLNENLWSSLKNLFGKLLQGVSDEIKKPVDELNNKLSKTKDPKQIQTIIANYLKVHNNTLTTQMKNAKDLPTLKKIVKDNLNGIYASITAVSQTLGADKFSFSEIFADSPAEMKKLFDQDSKKFNKNLDNYVNNLIITTAKQYPTYKEKPITKEILDKKPDEVKTEKETKQIDTAVNPTAQKPVEGKTNTEPAQAGAKTNASLDIEETDKLFEADAPIQPAAQPAKQTPEQADYQKLKDAMKKWFDFAIYKKVNDTLKKQKAGGNKPQGTIEDNIKNIKTTMHPDSVTAIANALTKADKQKLMQVRDLLGLDVKSAPL